MDMCSGKDWTVHKGIIYMVPRPNLGGDSIYTLRLVYRSEERRVGKECVP